MMQPQMSDQDLRRLAAILQEQRGEGLAFINPQEAGLLSALGGSGQPIAGTQGLGVGQGPIKSYAWYDPTSWFEDDDDDTTTTTTDDTTTTTDDTTTPTTTTAPELTAPANTEIMGPLTEEELAQKAADIQAEVTKTGDYDRSNMTAAQIAFYDHMTGTGGYTSTTTTTTTPTTTTTAPTYYDKLGRGYSTQALATAADTRIDTQRASLQNLTFPNLTLDSTWDQFKTEAANYADLPESEVEARFNAQLTVAVDQSRIQILNFSDVLSKQLQTFDQSALEGLTWDQVAQTLTGYEGVDDTGAAIPDRLSEEFRRGLFKTMLDNALRESRFTLTPEEVEQFASEAVQMKPVDDVAPVEMGDVAPAEEVTVGDVDAPDRVALAEIQSITAEELQKINAGVDTAIDLITDRYTGKAKSPAQEKLRQNTEKNLLMLMGTAAGGEVSPARLRQLRQLQADITQAAISDAAQMQSEEQLASEQQLVDLYKTKSTLRLETALSNLEVRKQSAFKQADLDQARNLAIATTKLTRVITKANLDRDVTLANLESRRLEAINQGKLDLAASLTNLEKDILISKTNASLALQSRGLDHALALSAYQGQMALEGIEVKIDLAEMQEDLTEMGFELTRDLAEMDDATKRYIADLTGQYKAAENDTNRQAAILNLLATGLAVYARLGSDIGMKTEIRAADDQVEGFLDALNAYQYRYKDPGAPGQSPGMFVGVMAQDLEKSPMGASFVSDTPDGKMVDYGHGLAAILASQSNLHDRLKRLED